MPCLLSILGPKAIPALSVLRVGPKLKKSLTLSAELPPLGTQGRPRFPVTSGWPLLSQEANQDQFTELLASGRLVDWRGQLGDRPTWPHLCTIRTPARHALLFTLLPSKLPLFSPLKGLLSCLKDFTAN